MATILFVVPRFHTNLWFGTRALIEAGHRVEMAVGEIAPGEDHSFVTPIVIGAAPDAGQASELLAQLNPDLVILRAQEGVARRFAKAARDRRIRTIRYNLKPATEITPLFRRLKNRWRGLPPRRMTPVPGLDARARRDPIASYIPFPVGILRPDVPRRHATGPLRILCIGKLAQRRKNQHLLIDALQTLERSGRQFELTLAGASLRSITGADEAHFDIQADAAQAVPWITLRVDVPFHEIGDHYASHDVCVLPSVGEPLGIAPLEGMAYGTIPVVSTHTGAAGLIVDEETGLRVDVTRDGALAAALARLIDNPEQRARLSTAARHFAETELSPNRYVARIEALLPPR